MITTTTTQTAAAATEELDPVAARAQFFFDLELMELTAVIPQAEAPTAVKNRF